MTARVRQKHAQRTVLRTRHLGYDIFKLGIGVNLALLNHLHCCDCSHELGDRAHAEGIGCRKRLVFFFLFANASCCIANRLAATITYPYDYTWAESRRG